MNHFSAFNLHDNINKAIEHCGYTTPTPVQTLSIPEVMAGKDVVVSAQTGTGKTASFVLPALHSLSQQPNTEKKPRVLILTPTRELANQITHAAGLYGKFMRFNIVSLVGGVPYDSQNKALARGADIIVATPGRLMDHMEQKRVDLSHVSILVLDEADRMLDMGFIDDVQTIAKLTPNDRQTLLFSATLDNKLMKEIKHLLKNPARIDLSSEKVSAPKIQQTMYKVSNMQHKTRLLKHFLSDENIYKAIIFAATKIHASKLAHQLCDEGFAAAPLHGDLRQKVRSRTLDQLRRGKIQYLVATDVAARGIDVSDITHVINYDLPKFCEDYVHRIGRTGRAGKEGTAISFVSPADFRHLQSIERYIGQRIKLLHHAETEHDSTERSKSTYEERHEKFDRGQKPRFNQEHRENRQQKRQGNHEKFDRDEKPRFNQEYRENRQQKRYGKHEKYDRDEKPRFNQEYRENRQQKRHETHEKFGRDEEPRFNQEYRESRQQKRQDKYEKFDRDQKPRFNQERHENRQQKRRGHEHRYEKREWREKDDADFSSRKKRDKMPPARVEFKESHRKVDGHAQPVRVEFKSGKPKQHKFEKDNNLRKSSRTHNDKQDYHPRSKKFSKENNRPRFRKEGKKQRYDD